MYKNNITRQNENFKKRIQCPFKCDLCEFSTTRKPYLSIHKRIHTGEKPFKCDECDFCSNQKSNVTRHKRVHTGRALHPGRPVFWTYPSHPEMSSYLQWWHQPLFKWKNVSNVTNVTMKQIINAIWNNMNWITLAKNLSNVTFVRRNFRKVKR